MGGAAGARVATEAESSQALCSLLPSHLAFSPPAPLQHRIQHRQAPPTALVEMHVAGQHPRVEHVHPEHHADHTPESAPLFVPQLPPAAGGKSATT